MRRRRAARRSKARARMAQARDGAGDLDSSGTELDVKRGLWEALFMCETGDGTQKELTVSAK